jgi:outer membrane protein TolC
LIRESLISLLNLTFHQRHSRGHANQAKWRKDQVEDAAMPIPNSTTMQDARIGRLRAGVNVVRALALAGGLVAVLPATSAAQRCGATLSDSSQADSRDAPDTTVTLGPCLSLDTIIARTLVHSPAVAGALGAVRDATALRRVTIGAYLPTLVLNGITGKTTQSTSTTTSTTTSTSPSVATTSGAGVTALVDVFTGGRRGAQRKQADAIGRSADAGLVLQRYATIFTATLTYLDVLRAHELIRVASDQAAQAGLGLDYVLRRQTAGTAMTADVLSARLALSTARQAQLAASDTLITTTAALGRLVGANGPVDAEPSAKLEPVPLLFRDSEVVALAVATSPAVLSTRAQASADTAAVRAAKTLYIPTVAAGAGYNRATSTPFAGGLRSGWIIELTTSFPLFDGFLREQTITQAQVASDVATVTALDTRRLASATAVQLLGNLHVAEHNIELARESVRLATENLRIFRLRYSAGIATILDVLTAQTSLVQAELSQVSARFNYQSTRASLEALLGRRL